MPLAEWIADNHIGDWASIAGVAVSIVGFIFTITNVVRSRSAAERAAAAAVSAQRTLRTYEALSDFSGAIVIMEEIKRLHRTGDTNIVLDRYATLRRTLIGVRRRSPGIDEITAQRIQSAIASLATMEDAVEKDRAAGKVPDFVRLNRVLSREIDDLHVLLVDMTIPNEE